MAFIPGTTAALRIFEGGGPRRAAEETGIALSGVRTHLLRISEKACVHRQADLVRLLASLAPGRGDWGRPAQAAARPLLIRSSRPGRPVPPGGAPASGTPQAGPRSAGAGTGCASVPGAASSGRRP